MRAPGAAVGRSGGGVRVYIAKPHPIVGDAVGARNLAGGDDRQDEPVRRVGAAVVDEVVAERQDATLVVEADLDLVHLAPLLVDRGEMLLAVLGPLHGPAELHRGVRDQKLVGIEEHDLRPEAATHIRRDHLHLRLRQSKQDGEAATD